MDKDNGNDNRNSNGNGFKYTIISGIIALIASMAAVLGPMYKMTEHSDTKIIEYSRRINELGNIINQLEQTVAVLRQQVDNDTKEIKNAADKSADNKSNIFVLNEKLIEVETQFRWMTDVVNARTMQLNRIDTLLWKKVFVEDLPPLEYSTLGPGHNGKSSLK